MKMIDNHMKKVFLSSESHGGWAGGLRRSWSRPQPRGFPQSLWPEIMLGHKPPDTTPPRFPRGPGNTWPPNPKLLCAKAQAPLKPSSASGFLLQVLWPLESFFTVSVGKLKSGYSLHSSRCPASCRHSDVPSAVSIWSRLAFPFCPTSFTIEFLILLVCTTLTLTIKWICWANVHRLPIPWPLFTGSACRVLPVLILLWGLIPWWNLGVPQMARKRSGLWEGGRGGTVKTKEETHPAAASTPRALKRDLSTARSHPPLWSSHGSGRVWTPHTAGPEGLCSPSQPVPPSNPTKVFCPTLNRTVSYAHVVPNVQIFII